MTTKKVLLVHGFIRNISALFQIRLSTDIISICVSFYDLDHIKLFISFHYSSNAKYNDINILDINTCKVIKLRQNKMLGEIESDRVRDVHLLQKPYCYISNVSSITKNTNYFNSNKIYHGILSTKTQSESYDYGRRWRTHYYTNIIIFEAETGIISEIRKISGYPVLNQQHLFCGSKYGIISVEQNQSHLYQLKLDNIDFDSKQFKFKSICNDSFWSYSRSYLNMSYLNDNESIFAMGSNRQHRKCAIFDLGKTKWINVNNYDIDVGNKRLQKYFKPTISFNHNRMNNVYVIDNYGQTSVFDMVKNKWILLNSCKELMYDDYRLSVLWMYDTNILKSITQYNV